MDSVFNWHIMVHHATPMMWNLHNSYQLRFFRPFPSQKFTLKRKIGLRVAPWTIAILLGPRVSKWEESVGFSDPEGDSRILPIESLLSWHGGTAQANIKCVPYPPCSWSLSGFFNSITLILTSIFQMHCKLNLKSTCLLDIHCKEVIYNITSWNHPYVKTTMDLNLSEHIH